MSTSASEFYTIINYFSNRFHALFGPRGGVPLLVFLALTRVPFIVERFRFFFLSFPGHLDTGGISDF